MQSYRPSNTLGFPGRDALRQPEIAELAGQPDEADGLVQAESPDFFSYIDGELDEKDREAVEEFIRQHPQFLPELEAWRQTISYPDPALVCPDKESLYKESGQNRIICCPWIKAGVAAAIAGSVALLLLPRAHRQTAPTNYSGYSHFETPGYGFFTTGGYAPFATSGDNHCRTTIKIE